MPLSCNLLPRLLKRGSCVLLSLVLASPAAIAFTEYDLFDALFKKNLTMVNVILAADPALATKETIDRHTSELQTPMTSVACWGWVPGGQLLLAKKASVNKGDPSPLAIASHRGFLPFVEFLLKRGADVKAVSSFGYSALQEAVWNGHKDVAAVLLKNGAKTDLFADAGLGRVEIVESSLKKDPSLIKKKGQYGGSLMHWAAAGDSVAVASVLLVNKVDLDTRNDSEQTPLELAITNHSQLMVPWLLNHGADFKTSGAEVKAKALNSNDVLLYSWSGNCETAIEAAVRSGNIEALQLLLQKGADPNHRGIDGGTPLHLAALFGRVEMAKQLLAHGAKVNAVCDIHTVVRNDSPSSEISYKTPLHYAVSANNFEMVSLLVEKKADVNATMHDMGSHTPLSIARDHEYTQLVEYLRQRGAKF